MDKKEVIQNLNTLFKQRVRFYSYLDRNIPKINNTEIFDFDKAQCLNARELYRQFYDLDYAMRRLLPAIYKKYEITDSDLDKDF